jgi:hypothetical protein
VYLFEEGEPLLPASEGAPPGRQYLGEFRVTEAAAQGATLQPVLPLDQFESQRLAAQRAPWVMYEVMPRDSHEIFAAMSEEEIKSKIPPESVEEYLRHGKPAGPDDDQWHRAAFDETGKRLPPDQMEGAAKVLYQRRLHDYALEFDELAQRRAVMLADREGVKRDLERLKEALASAQKLREFRTDEIEKLTTDLANVTRDRQAIEAHFREVQQQVAEAEMRLAETLERNRQLAQELAAR